MENQIEKVNASDVFVDFLKELGSYADEQQIVSYLYTRSVKEAAEGRAIEKEDLQPQLSKLPEFTGDDEGRLNAIQELNAKKRNLLAKYDGKAIAFDADGFIEAAKNANLSYEQIERIIGEQLKVLKDNYAKNVEDERRDFQFHKLHPEFQKNPLPRVHENSDGALTTFFSKGEFGTILPTFRAKDKDSGEEIFYSNFHVESERPLSDKKEDEGKSVYTLSDGKRTVEMTDENFSRLTSPEIVRSFLNSLDESMQEQLEAEKSIQEEEEKNQEQPQTTEEQQEPLKAENSVQNEKDIETASEEPSPQPETTEAEQEIEEAEQEIKMMHDTMYHTNSWDENFPPVFSSKTYREMKNNPNLEQLRIKAKSGDLDAAYKYTNSIADINMIASMKKKFPNAIACPVIAEESTGNNMIPVAYAELMKTSGFTVSTDIKQSVRAHHTGANSIQRFVNRVRFSGEVEKGKEYILIDDHVDYGGTLRDLKDFIESNGGKVVAFSTLTSVTKDTRILPEKETVDKLNEYGGTIDELLRQFGITDNKNGLTDGETKGLLKILSNTSRDRKFGSRSQEIFGLLCQQASDELKAKQKQEEKTRPVLNRFVKISSRLTPQEQQKFDTQIKEIINAINSGNKNVATVINNFTPSKNNKETEQYITLIKEAHSSIEPIQKQSEQRSPEQGEISSIQAHFNELYPELAGHSLPDFGYDSNGKPYIGYSDHEKTIIPEFKMEVDGEEKTFKNFYLKNMSFEDKKAVYTVSDGKQEFKLPDEVQRRISNAEYVKSYFGSIEKEYALKQEQSAAIENEPSAGNENYSPSYEPSQQDDLEELSHKEQMEWAESTMAQNELYAEAEGIDPQKETDIYAGRTGEFVRKLTVFLHDNPAATPEEYKKFYDENYNLKPAVLTESTEFTDGRFQKITTGNIEGGKIKWNSTLASSMKLHYTELNKDGVDYLAREFSPSSNSHDLKKAAEATRRFAENLDNRHLWQKEQKNLAEVNDAQTKYVKISDNTGTKIWDDLRAGLDMKPEIAEDGKVHIKLFNFSDETKYPPDDPRTADKKKAALNALVGKELPKMSSGMADGNVYLGEILEDYVIAGYDEMGERPVKTENGWEERKVYDYETLVIQKTNEDGSIETRHLPVKALENALTIRAQMEMETQKELAHPEAPLQEKDGGFGNTQDNVQALQEKFEDQLGIGQDQLRLNTAANFIHNFKLRCRMEARNSKEFLDIARELYKGLNDTEKKKFVQMKDLYEKQYGEKYECFMLRELKEEIEPFTHTPSPFCPESVIKPLYGNEVKEKTGTPVNIGSKVCVGDEFRLKLFYKSAFGDDKGKKDSIVTTQTYRVASTNPVNNCVVLMSEDNKEAITVPIDKFLEKAEKAKEMQLKDKEKNANKEMKVKKTDFSMEL